MIVLDTHAWVWWVHAPDRLGRAARAAIESAESVGICTFSCWEVATLVSRGRLELDREVGIWVRQAITHEAAAVLPVTTEIALRAALLDQGSFPADPADRVIYATAVQHGARLATADVAITAFDPARAVWE